MPLALQYLLLILGIGNLCAIIYSVSMCLVSRVMGRPVPGIRIFFGRAWLRFHFPLLGKVEIGWIPAGGNVPLIESSPSEETHIIGERIARTPLWWRLGLWLTPLLVYLGLATAALGVEQAGREILDGFWQFFQGAFSPLGRAQEMLAGVLARPWWEIGAMFMAKFVATEVVCPRNLVTVLLPRVNAPLLFLSLVMMANMLSWAVGFVYFLWHL